MSSSALDWQRKILPTRELAAQSGQERLVAARLQQRPTFHFRQVERSELGEGDRLHAIAGPRIDLLPVGLDLGCRGRFAARAFDETQRRSSLEPNHVRADPTEATARARKQACRHRLRQQ